MAGRQWARVGAAVVAGAVLAAGAMAGSALLLYGGRGFLGSAGFLIATVMLATGGGVWIGAPDGPVPGSQRTLGRWVFAVLALVLASFVATFWLRSPALQASRWGGPLALVVLVAEPAYAMGALLAALEARRRAWLGGRWYALRTGTGATATSGHDRGAGRASGVAVPALVGGAVGAALAAAWLIPAFPPGLVYMGLALLLTAAGSLEMGLAGEPKGGTMVERGVIITGVGDSGQVGYALAEAFVREGARVLVTSRGEAIAERARALGPDVVGVPADLADPEGAEAVVEAARERLGRLDVLVNVAGGLHVMKSVAETVPGEWQREVDSNARTAFLMCRAALPLLRDSRGAIINFASPAGLRAVKGMAAYSAGKAGVVALTRALAREECGRVRVNAVAPGMVDTAQNRESVDDPEAVDWVTRDEIADVVLFLAGDAASGINGETVQVLGSGL